MTLNEKGYQMAGDMEKKTDQPCVGILMLDTTFPRIPGDIGNPDTFDFPVQYKVVKGASPERIVLKPDTDLIRPFIEAGRWLIKNGARIITTSCGFLALFHKELTRALAVPVFSSSLLQVHMARAVIGKNKKVGIITAHKESLTQQHFAAIGIDHCNTAIMGMEESEEFSSVFINGKQTLDKEKCGKEMRAATLKLVRQHPDMAAIVLECTNMPPYARIVRDAANGLPVFDMVTMVNYAHSTMKFT